MPRHVRKGDTVMVTAGNDKGAVGEVLRIIPSKNRVIVKGVNVRTRNIKPTQANPKGGQLRAELSIHLSNVSPVVDGKPARVRFEKQDDGAKVRIGLVRDEKGKKSEKVLGEVHAATARP